MALLALLMEKTQRKNSHDYPATPRQCTIIRDEVKDARHLLSSHCTLVAVSSRFTFCDVCVPCSAVSQLSLGCRDQELTVQQY
jgi:hypothetical protein